ncbi:MAG: DUF192 domain-containing protein [Gammaproteobacteria bacterium]|nr:DUF192 domain-containing protein [Gammaproteobacteria bacterium]
MKFQLLVCSLVLFALTFMTGCTVSDDDCQKMNDGMKSMHQTGLSLFDDHGNAKHIHSLIADDQFEQAYGFQHVCPDVIQDTKILFVYSEPTLGSFHMSNVKAPLDIGFFDQHGVLFDVLRMDVYVDNEQLLYSPTKPFQFALETHVGFFEKFMLSPGKSYLIIDSL